MTEPRILRFYLDDGMRQSAAAGQHNFIRRVAGVAQRAGYGVEYLANSDSARLLSARRKGFAMFHMDDPFHDHALTMRRVYQYPFWAIESSARRWEWRVARSRFQAGDTDPAKADKFYRFWQGRLFGGAPRGTTQDGFVYVPLQGKIRDHRSFQACSPLEMIEKVLQHDPVRQVIATLHPNETYSGADRDALDRLEQSHPRLSVQTGEMAPLLQACDYVVTQNSSVAFSGYFFGKPAVLFARIDFHHIAANVHELGAQQALAKVTELEPDYAGYLHWFWQEMSINAGRAEAEGQIRDAFVRAGWPM